MSYQLYVFGSNGEGQLGIPAEEIVSTPTVAESWSPEAKIKAIRGGDNHTLILTDSGEVWGAGDNRRGQLGLPTSGNPRCEEINRLRGDVEFCAAACESSAYVTIPILSGGEYATLSTEGTGHWGELGIGEASKAIRRGSEHLPRQLPGPHAVVDLAAGGWHYVAIRSDGSVYGWGKSRLDQLGPKLSPQQRVTTPTEIEEPISFAPVKAVCGKEFTYLASDPFLGQHCLFGRDKFALRTSMPPHIKNWKSIGATWNAIFVLFEDGSLLAWGKDNMWKLLPDGLPLLEQMAVGSEHVLAVTKDGRLISWGWGKHGNCGDLRALGDKVKDDLVNGFWNEIEIPGKIEFVGAGFCTSFVLTNAAKGGG